MLVLSSERSLERKNMMKHWYLNIGLLLAAMLILAPAAFADDFQTYNLAWSGASFENSASATGQITLDLTTLTNPGSGYITGDIQSLSVTVTGAGSGNGTWTLTDLFQNLWGTGGATLNMEEELVGQPTGGHPWGTSDGMSGDFNLWFTGGPIGVTYFTLETTSGDELQLTEFDPATATPEPGTMLLFGSGLVGLAGMVRRKIARRA
jgi:hypothetical protein